ncbi:hypothetical protein SAMN04488541_1003161 [Thermoflexibacter ruber]|uniref:Uncharacterized protein n=1 Tax=Thermoflexibacter ruber TaxID=1003 RepID=A0A1I2BUP5_9BACT|nr:hypothetical protein SAMN04488541_1003161 [Thermoflexibacter ruber]
MKTCKLIILVSFLIFSHLTFSQTIFKVLASRGQVMLGSEKLKVGTQLSANQNIEIGSDAYLCLATLPEHKIVELTAKDKGKHNTKDILAKVPANQNWQKTYVGFVVNELTKQDNSGITAKNRFQHMNKTGAVKRGGVAKSFIEDIRRDMGNKVPQVYGDKILLIWYLGDKPNEVELAKSVRKYKIEIMSSSDETVFFEQIVEGKESSELLIDLAKVKNNGDNDLVYKITALDEKGKKVDTTNIDTFPIKLMSESEKKTYAKDLAKFSNQSVLSLLEKAQYFENKGLYIDAMVAYKEAEELMK